jgi:hypothetical protein
MHHHTWPKIYFSHLPGHCELGNAGQWTGEQGGPKEAAAPILSAGRGCTALSNSLKHPCMSQATTFPGAVPRADRALPLSQHPHALRGSYPLPFPPRLSAIEQSLHR